VDADRRILAAELLRFVADELDRGVDPHRIDLEGVGDSQLLSALIAAIEAYEGARAYSERRTAERRRHLRVVGPDERRRV